jgi:transcriptional regulator with XRE-family HTH domain
MKNIAGLLIRTNRERQNLKQEVLCRGICAVSYLSKIEKGILQPGKEIQDQLFKKLSIEYIDDETFVKKGKEFFQTAYLSSLTGIKISEKDEQEVISQKDRYLNSPLFIDYVLFEQYYKKDIQNSKMDFTIYLEYMDKDQLFLAFLISGGAGKEITLLEKAKGIKYEPEVVAQMAYLKWHSGKYYEAIELYLDALELAYRRGYFELQQNICLLLGHIYMDFDLRTMQKYYDKVLQLANLLNNTEYNYQVYYHIGVANTRSNFEIARDNLLKCIEECPDKSGIKESAYQKTFLLYVRYGKREEGIVYYEKAMETNYYKDINEMLNIVVNYPNYMHQKEYLKRLKGIYDKAKQYRKFSYTKYYGEFLVEALKANRKYKEALEIAEFIYNQK